MRSRKGSLQLSINAIVVLILAITLLGLGLNFVRTMFMESSKNFEVTNQKLRTQIKEQIEQNNDLLFLKRKDLEIKSGSPDTLYFGISNTDQNRPRCFYPQFYCQNARGDYDNCNLMHPNGNYTENAWVRTFNSLKIPAGDSEAVFAEIQPSGPAEDYTGRLYVWRSTGTIEDCAPPLGDGTIRPIQVEINESLNYTDADSNALVLHDVEDFNLHVK